MGKIYKFLGMKSWPAKTGTSAKKPAYGRMAEFGFDYLRDNMVTQPGMRVQRGHHLPYRRRVDSIACIEARTPLFPKRGD